MGSQIDMLKKLPEVLENAQTLWEKAIPADLACEALFDDYEGVRCANRENSLIISENLAAAKSLLAAIRAGTSAPFRLIYMDPPFFTRTKYTANCRILTNAGEALDLPQHAFHDIWRESGDTEEKGLPGYLIVLMARVIAARDLLAEDGCLWLHLDHHAVHYAKTLTDAVFGGGDHLINEVVWQYKSGGSTKKRFSRKHDTLLFYAKDHRRYYFMPMEEKSYNRGRKAYRFKGVKEYRDDGGWYTLVNMKDVWSIDMVGRTSFERTGYATQKPEELLGRIIESCSKEGDLCGDLYGGSGTLAAAAQRRGRRWVAIDENPLAAMHSERRLAAMGAPFSLLAGGEALDGKEGDGKVRFEGGWKLLGTMYSGKKLLSLTVTAYHPDEAFMPKLPAERKKFLTACETCPGGMVFGLAVDPVYDGSTFRPKGLAYGKGNVEVLAGADDISAGESSFALRVTDVFGRCYYCLSPYRNESEGVWTAIAASI